MFTVAILNVKSFTVLFAQFVFKYFVFYYVYQLFGQLGLVGLAILDRKVFSPFPSGFLSSQESGRFSGFGLYQELSLLVVAMVISFGFLGSRRCWL